ncbi:MAG TPA: glycosyltransferase [Gemmatimonadetes bacterium]|nr:glycosyltransferase [Gemmatimonadota bacterium]
MPVVLVFVRNFNVSGQSDGPTRSIVNLSRKLVDVNFRIVASNVGGSDTSDGRQQVMPQWQEIDGFKVMDVGRNLRSVRWIKKILSEQRYNLVYLNSFFDPFLTLLPLLILGFSQRSGHNVIVAPRGELFASALASGRWKKRFYLTVIGVFDVYEGIIFQAASAHERKVIRKHINSAGDDIRVVSDIVTLGAFSGCSEKFRASGSLRLVYLSRITPAKNLIYALEIIGKSNVQVSLDIYGEIVDSMYWRLCEKYITKHDLGDRVQYRGEVDYGDVHQLVGTYDAFILPTKAESFGHAIGEALSVGTPVIISDATPWQGLEDEGAGIGIALLEQNKFVTYLSWLSSLSEVEYRHLRIQARRFVVEMMSNPRVLADNKNLILDYVRDQQVVS